MRRLQEPSLVSVSTPLSTGIYCCEPRGSPTFARQTEHGAGLRLRRYHAQHGLGRCRRLSNWGEGWTETPHLSCTELSPLHRPSLWDGELSADEERAYGYPWRGNGGSQASGATFTFRKRADCEKSSAAAGDPLYTAKKAQSSETKQPCTVRYCVIRALHDRAAKVCTKTRASLKQSWAVELWPCEVAGNR